MFRIVPWPCVLINSPTARESRSVATTSSFHRAASFSSNDQYAAFPVSTSAPALLTQISAARQAQTSLTKRSWALVSDKSARSTCASHPSARIFSAVSSAPLEFRRAWTNTFAPAAANSSAIARPMPLELPVTTAVCPFRLSLSSAISVESSISRDLPQHHRNNNALGRAPALPPSSPAPRIRYCFVEEHGRIGRLKFMFAAPLVISATRHKWFPALMLVLATGWWVWHATYAPYYTLVHVIVLFLSAIGIGIWFVIFGSGRRRTRLMAIGAFAVAVAAFFTALRPVYNGDMGVYRWRWRFAKSEDASLHPNSTAAKIEDWKPGLHDYPGFL